MSLLSSAPSSIEHEPDVLSERPPQFAEAEHRVLLDAYVGSSATSSSIWDPLGMELACGAGDAAGCTFVLQSAFAAAGMQTCRSLTLPTITFCTVGTIKAGVVHVVVPVGAHRNSPAGPS